MTADPFHFCPARENTALLARMLTAYYREGEDADTPEAELEDFISLLLGLLEDGVLCGELLFKEHIPAGFVLFAMDAADYPFSECPGLGTIAEIGVVPSFRRQGCGRMLAAKAEEALRKQTQEAYVCVHPSAEAFWRSCGYRPTGRTGGNDLPLFIKPL